MKYPKYSLLCITHLVSKTIFDLRSIFLIISLKIRIRIKIRIPFMTIAGVNILFFFDGFAVKETLPRRRYEFLSDRATGSFTRRLIDRVVVFEAKHASNTTLHGILNLRTIQSHAIWKQSEYSMKLDVLQGVYGAMGLLGVYEFMGFRVFER